MTGIDQEAWEERYRSRPAVWSKRPNSQLVAEATDLAPGTALDVGCGEGADAVWLALRGWQVTAVDFSSTALERGEAQAEASGVSDRIEWLHADLTAWQPPEQSFQLVSTQFMQLPAVPRQAVFGRLVGAVAPGGTLLVVGHHPSDLHTSVRRPPRPEFFYSAEEVAAGLEPAEWDVVVAEARPRAATDAGGREVTISDTVVRARRHE